MIASLSRYHISEVVFDGWIHGEHIMKFTLNQFTDDECNKLINLAWSGFRKASIMDPCRDASRIQWHQNSHHMPWKMVMMKPMRIIRLLILGILSAFEWLHVGYRNDFNAIMGFIMRMHYNVNGRCSCYHWIHCMYSWHYSCWFEFAWYRAWNNSWLKMMIAHWIQMPSTLFITRFQYPMNAILHVDMLMNSFVKPLHAICVKNIHMLLNGWFLFRAIMKVYVINHRCWMLANHPRRFSRFPCGIPRDNQ